MSESALRIEFNNRAQGPAYILITAGENRNIHFAKSGDLIHFAQSRKVPGMYYTACYDLTDSRLSNGIDIYAAVPSIRIYVSLSAALDADAFSSFGLPSPTNVNDPNFRVRWDVIELAVSAPRNAGDSGDLTTINALGVPMMIETFSTPTPGSTPKTTARSYGPGAPQYKAIAKLAADNASNNNMGGRLPPDGRVTNSSGDFVRLIGPPNGAFRLPPNPMATGGPYPSLNHYLAFVSTEDFKTTISDAGRVPNVTYDLALSSTGRRLVLSGGMKINAVNLNFQMFLNQDSNVGQPDALYTFSSMVYEAPGAGSDNPGLSFFIDGIAKTEHQFVEMFEVAASVLAQIYHDVFSAFNFGLVGNFQKVPHWDHMPYGNMTLNDMGSAGWVALAGDVGGSGSHAVNLADVPIFTLRDRLGNPCYNQWAALLYKSSPTVYGFAYSDFLQPGLPQSTDVGSWRISILPDAPV